MSSRHRASALPAAAPVAASGRSIPPVVLLAGGLLLFGLGAVAAIAYGTAGGARSAAPEQAAAPAARLAEPVSMTAPYPAAQVPAQPGATGVVPAAPAGPAARAADPLVTRVTEEAKAGFEAHRAEIVSRCLPQARSRNAKVTLNLTFDANGREIARGISEDRRAPAREFAQCLRNLPGTRLAVAPPGTNVAVSMPVSYP